MADYNMRNTGASVDDTVENYLDKRVGGTVTGSVAATVSITTPLTITDALKLTDLSLSVDVSTLCDQNIINLGTNSLPVADPLIAGRLWNNSSILTVSAG